MSQRSKRRVLITHTNPKSPISETYRTLRTNIEFSAVDSEIKRVMITSAGPGEGKSTTIANLAVTYAQADKKVLLIDADLRKPTIHRILTVSNRRGLTTILSGNCAAHEGLIESDIPNLYLLPSGPIPPNPSEMLSSRKFKELLAEFGEHFDHILIDSPPVLAVTDAQIISTLCDGVVLVINSGGVKSGYAIKAKESLDHVQARILGVVLNNVNRKSKDAYYYYYYGEEK